MTTNTRYTQTFNEWLKGADTVPIIGHAPCIGIHDSRAIEHVRTYLWDLADYRVSSVQAGVIWLMPRVTLAETIERAKREAESSGQMRIVYRAMGNYGVAATLPAHGERVGNYYPAGYTINAGWYPTGIEVEIESDEETEDPRDGDALNPDDGGRESIGEVSEC